MTHMTRRGFRRAAFAVLAAAALTGGSVAAASAATAGGSPQPNGSYTQQYGYHQPRHCEFDWLSGFTVDHDGQAQDTGYRQQPYGQQTYGQPKAEKVEAFQLVRVCETGEHLTVTDIGRPFVEETEATPPEPYASPTPYASPSDYLTPAHS
jgi:hypothetical protein